MIRSTALVALALGAAACGEDSGNLNGSLSFDYSGTTSGSFIAVGRAPLSNRVNVAWAAAVRENEGVIIVFAQLPRSPDTYDGITVVVPRLTPGSDAVTLAVNCSSFICATVEIEFDVPLDGGAAQICRLSSGTVALTSISDKRVSGSFSGTGTCSGAAGSSSFAVTNGMFDVPIISVEASLRAP